MEITGRVTADATVTTTKSDKQVVNFNIAIAGGYKAKNGQWIDQTEFVRCAYWISAGIAKLLTKGTYVSLYGRISTQAWQGSDGEAKAALQFHTSDIKFPLGTKKQGRESTQTSSETKPSEGRTETAALQGKDDDLPF